MDFLRYVEAMTVAVKVSQESFEDLRRWNSFVSHGEWVSGCFGCEGDA